MIQEYRIARLKTYIGGVLVLPQDPGILKLVRGGHIIYDAQSTRLKSPFYETIFYILTDSLLFSNQYRA